MTTWDGLVASLIGIFGAPLAFVVLFVALLVLIAGAFWIASLIWYGVSDLLNDREDE